MMNRFLSKILGTNLELEDVEILDDVDALLEVDTLEDVDTLKFQPSNVDKPNHSSRNLKYKR